MPLGHARTSGGFTLIELVVTMVVLAILAMAAQPSLRDFFDRYRLRGAGDDVVSLISNARAEAVKADLDVSIKFAGSGTSWCVGANAATLPTGGSPAGLAGACDCTDTASTTECRVAGQRAAVETGAHSDIEIGTLPSTFVFDSKLGTVVPLGAHTVILTSPSRRYDLNVEVSPLGQARLCTPSGKPTMAGVSACT